MNYYFEVLTNNVSLIKEDMGHFYFEIGDIIEIYFTHTQLRVTKVIGQKSTVMIVRSPKFYIDQTKHFAISSLILNGNFTDVTEMVLREKKLNNLGI